jgi:hypothetical protein
MFNENKNEEVVASIINEELKEGFDSFGNYKVHRLNKWPIKLFTSFYHILMREFVLFFGGV